MVVVQIKLGEQDGFLYEATCATPNDSLVRDLVHVHNARIRLANLNAYVPGLFAHGVAKHPQNQGIDSFATEPVRKEEFYEEDPLGQRTGNGVCPSLRETLGRMVEDVKAYLKSNLREPVLLPALQEKLDNFRGIVMMGFPMGLPETSMDPATAELWWAGKQFFRDDTVGDRVGKNEKTKREPAVSEDERKAMMAHYFKKQEELKKLADEDEDDYLHSSWANPSALKNQLRGTNNLRPF
ncbi:hypothetical protein SPRG_06710 [Saprolegnia parasitica CBS 223.65]|uniref:Uncharacterized protein n=1 Tax=Saprolegnia parasitica (strain CBS 223.65) TaxID=695850 RepID=A0A067CPK1_SAPPC|nr:hypothetical protein SPRG_06710 [Saprolegnia parasitica CBS 223.65]KDO28471.1 hypothetical protein SPRG_06710 [Saprolegnia parasitica CBS 223.65]|eukprot:XP_012200910.1 hypothetical protein SPRG_06710 [Saprolegnia parasitica CBS 223.65]